MSSSAKQHGGSSAGMRQGQGGVDPPDADAVVVVGLGTWALIAAQLAKSSPRTLFNLMMTSKEFYASLPFALPKWCLEHAYNPAKASPATTWLPRPCHDSAQASTSTSDSQRPRNSQRNHQQRSRSPHTQQQPQQQQRSGPPCIQQQRPLQPRQPEQQHAQSQERWWLERFLVHSWLGVWWLVRETEAVECAATANTRMFSACVRVEFDRRPSPARVEGWLWGCDDTSEPPADAPAAPRDDALAARVRVSVDLFTQVQADRLTAFLKRLVPAVDHVNVVVHATAHGGVQLLTIHDAPALDLELHTTLPSVSLHNIRNVSIMSTEQQELRGVMHNVECVQVFNDVSPSEDFQLLGGIPSVHIEHTAILHSLWFLQDAHRVHLCNCGIPDMEPIAHIRHLILDNCETDEDESENPTFTGEDISLVDMQHMYGTLSMPYATRVVVDNCDLINSVRCARRLSYMKLVMCEHLTTLPEFEHVDHLELIGEWSIEELQRVAPLTDKLTLSYMGADARVLHAPLACVNVTRNWHTYFEGDHAGAPSEPVPPTVDRVHLDLCDMEQVCEVVVQLCHVKDITLVFKTTVRVDVSPLTAVRSLRLSASFDTAHPQLVGLASLAHLHSLHLSYMHLDGVTITCPTVSLRGCTGTAAIIGVRDAHVEGTHLRVTEVRAVDNLELEGVKHVGAVTNVVSCSVRFDLPTRPRVLNGVRRLTLHRCTVSDLTCFADVQVLRVRQCSGPRSVLPVTGTWDRRVHPFPTSIR